MRRTEISGAMPTIGAKPSRSTKSMPAPGGFATTERSCHWDELADRLIPYVVETRLHPYRIHADLRASLSTRPGVIRRPGSMRPSARFGDPDGFARFVDGAHRAGVGVILDWVPAHFPTDAHGLAHFDGTALYEHADPRQGFHPDWNTAIYNFGRREVVSLPRQQRAVLGREIPCRRFARRCGRLDALPRLFAQGRRMDPQRKGRPREPRGGLFPAEDEQARSTASHPGVMTIAEESTSWPKVSAPVHEGGLGFGFKWNMGFMHDTLEYMSPRSRSIRKHHHNELTFGLTLCLLARISCCRSRMTRSCTAKARCSARWPATTGRNSPTLRAYYAFMWGYPGKKLLFMGQEFAQRREWSEARALDWNLLRCPPASRACADGARSQLSLSVAPGAACAATASRKAFNG